MRDEKRRKEEEEKRKKKTETRAVQGDRVETKTSRIRVLCTETEETRMRNK